MCLAIPMMVVKKDGSSGFVEAGGVEYKVNFDLVPDVGIGDYVIVHAGFAIKKLDQNDADETLRLFKEMENL